MLTLKKDSFEALLSGFIVIPNIRSSLLASTLTKLKETLNLLN